MLKKLLVSFGLLFFLGVGQVGAIDWASGFGECHDTSRDESVIVCADGQAVKHSNSGATEQKYCSASAVAAGHDDGKCWGNECYYCPQTVAQMETDEKTKAFNVCNDVKANDPASFSKCDNCRTNGGYWSAIGCVPTDSVGMAAYLMRIAIGIAGVLLTAQIIIGSVQIIFASGDSGAITSAKKRITNSLIAIGFMIFGVAILQIIGVQILRIPGFFGI
jgi:hypothetical protein